MLRRFFSLIFLSLAMVGCATVPPPDIAVDQVRSWKLTQIEVKGSEVINSWPYQEKIYVTRNNISGDAAQQIAMNSVQNNAGLREFVRGALEENVTTRLRNALTNDLNGTRPVKAVVQVTQLDIPSAVRRLLVENQARFHAKIDIVDVGNGQVLASWPGEYVWETMAAGIGGMVLDQVLYSTDVAPRLLDKSFGYFRTWLVTR